jgi:hypothetical protein
MLVGARGFILVCDDILRSGNPWVGFLAKPLSISRGRNKDDLEPPGLATQMLALSKPPSMSRGGVYSIRKEEVVLDS